MSGLHGDLCCGCSLESPRRFFFFFWRRKAKLSLDCHRVSSVAHLISAAALRGSRGFECHMCVVVILGSRGRFTAWRALRSAFSITGTSLYKDYPGLAPII